MKKLMIAAAVTAVAGATFAANVFDYKASVKYVDFKQVSVSGNKVWTKTVKSTSLKGYLVTPQNCACTTGCAAREPGFLVLTSALAKKYDKDYQVKLMPANLLAEAWSQKGLEGVKSYTLEAQGYLFAGIGKNATMDPATGSPIYGFGDLDVTEATRFLFGVGNVSDNEGGVAQFIEPFLDAAGFGKAGWSTTEASICGKGSAGYCIKQLSGSVIGGSWSCRANWTLNGFLQSYRCQGWDNEAITAPAIDYTGREYKYNVISGTWSIKENTKIGGVALSELEDALLANATGADSIGASYATAQLVKACGQKLDKNFSLATFDLDGAYPGEFVKRWFAALQ